MDEETTRGYEVVYREAIRAPDFQRNSCDTLRARVGFLLSAATIATSFLGGLALRDHSDAGSWIAIGLFVGFGAFALRLLWPRAEGAEGFTATPSTVISEYLEPEDREPSEVGVIYRDLALFAEEAHDLNRDTHFTPLTNYFRVAITLLTAEIVAWIVDLAIRQDDERGRQTRTPGWNKPHAPVSGRRETPQVGSPGRAPVAALARRLARTSSDTA